MLKSQKTFSQNTSKVAFSFCFQNENEMKTKRKRNENDFKKCFICELNGFLKKNL